FGETDIVRLCNRTNFLRDVLAEFLAQLAIGVDATLESYEGHQCLAFEIVRPANDGGFGDLPVAHQRAFDFSGSNAVTRDIEHVIDAADNPEIAILVLSAAIASEVAVGYFGPIDLLVPFRVTPKTA